MYKVPLRMKFPFLVVLVIAHWSDFSSGQCSSEIRCRCVHYSTGWNVDCSGLGLTVSPEFYGVVNLVNLSYNKLDEIPKFNNTIHLAHLDISWNDIEQINSIRTKYSLESLQYLRSLNLSHNSIPVDNHHLDNKTFSDLHSLEHLDISYNNLTNKSFSIDEVLKDSVQLRQLSIDSVHTLSFGSAFSDFTNLTLLKIQGRCFEERLFNVNEDFFQHLTFIEHLDLSADLFAPTQNCSLHYIEKKAIANLRNLRSLDLSYNRQLGLCGLNNVTADLHWTNISILKANSIQCQHGISTVLFCDDLKPLFNTSLEYLSLDGNNIGSAQAAILHFLPKSLKWLSIRGNRFVRNRYAYCNLYHLVNLKHVDISNINSLAESDVLVDNFRCQDPPSREIYCLSQRAKHNATTKAAEINDFCINANIFPCAAGANNTYTNLTINGTIPLTCVDPFDHHNESYNTILIPPNLETLILNNAQLGYNFGWSAFSRNSLKKLIMSNNQLHSITGPICNVSYLTHLDVSNNFCSTLSPHAFSDMISLQVLNLSDNLLGFMLAQKDFIPLFTAQPVLRELDLSSNRITSLHAKIFQDLMLRHLYLANNKISDWTASIRNLNNLKYIDLSYNQIMYFSAKGISLLSASKATNLTINLDNNILQCTCESLHSLKWMTQKRQLFTNFSTLRCNDGERDYLENAVKQLNTDCASHITLIVITFGCIVVLLSIIVPGLLYRNRWRIRYWYYIVERRYGKGYQPQVNDTDYSFDAYLSYAENDRTILHDVIKHLEESHGYKICIRHRDFIPGCDIADNIINAIHQSRKVIFIITRRFTKSSWCLFEVRMALTEYIESRRGNNIMIIVFRENVSQKELPDYLSRVIQEEVSLEFPQNPENEETFWTSLNESLR